MAYGLRQELDTTGAFGYFCAGKFPRRPWTEAVPPILDGATPKHAWGGYLSWAEHPHMATATNGYIVTANNRVASALPATLSGGFWEPPYRATRIASLLGQARNANVRDMADIQGDTVSIQAAGILASLLRPARERLANPRVTVVGSNLPGGVPYLFNDNWQEAANAAGRLRRRASSRATRVPAVLRTKSSRPPRLSQ